MIDYYGFDAAVGMRLYPRDQFYGNRIGCRSVKHHRLTLVDVNDSIAGYQPPVFGAKVGAMHVSTRCYGVYFECGGFVNGWTLCRCDKGAGAKYQEQIGFHIV